MSAITDAPNTYGFGLDFNYASWPKDTEVTLVNVPWNNDYRDIVKFDDRAALNTYIDTLENTGIKISGLSYVKPNQPIRIETPFNSAYRFNYLRASNPLQPIGSDVRKDFYYFITDVRYIAPNTTELILQLDVWQTFGFDVTFGNSYIERGHIGIANENNFNNYGRDYLTIPEGLDIGGEYLVGTRRKDKILDAAVDDYHILVVSSTRLEADPGDASDPKLSTPYGSILQGITSGAGLYIFTRSEFMNFMFRYSAFPWITQGIMSITVIPNVERYGYSRTFLANHNNVDFYSIDPDGMYVGKGKYTNLFPNWRTSVEVQNLIPERYRHLNKFLTYPYMIIEMTTWGGTPVIIKPESWADDNARITEKAVLTPPNQKVVIYPNRYNAKKDSVIDTTSAGGTTQYLDDGGDYLDTATQISNFPTLPIVNNMGISYLASNANSIAFQRNSADWSQQRALNSNQVSYDQQSAGILASQTQNSMQRNAMGQTVSSDQMALIQGTGVNAVANVIGGTVGGALQGSTKAAAMGGITGVANAIMGGMNASISIEQQNRGLAINQNLSRGINNSQNTQAGYMRDTNKSLADWAARGDYQNTIAGINAKVQDAQMLQPSTSGQVGGEAFNMVHSAVEVSLRWKLIDDAAIRRVGEYWLRYGYAVMQFAVIPASLKVMSKFTYWKLSETYISAATMPEYFKQAIRGIFEKGVTVWSAPEYIGTTDIADNDPLEGITL